MSENGTGYAPAKRSLGQNFLVDQNICRRIVEAVAPSDQDLVLEIGPGRGALTDFLVKAEPERCIALEKDRALAASLQARLPSVEVVQGDALEFDWASVEGPRLKLAGNLPYNVASRIIWDVVSLLSGFDRAVFMVQHEVGQRLCAASGTRQYGALSVWVQAFCEVEYLFKVPPSVFRPRPKVDSAVVRLRPRSAKDRPGDAKALDRLVKLCFQKRRKQLKNILKDALGDKLEETLGLLGIAPTLRPEALEVGQFVALSAAF